MKKILILAANPKATTRLRLEQEVRDIENGLRRSQYRNEFKLIQKWAVRPRDIQRSMLDETPQIVHFSGHGEGEDGLVFEDNLGNPFLVSGEALANLFKLFADEIECVLLNGCYSEVQANAIVQHIDYVIGMSQAISDEAAIEFAVALYDALGAGRGFEFAFELACNAIELNTTPIAKGGTRKLTPASPVEKSTGKYLAPVLLKRNSLSEASEQTSASLGASKTLEKRLDREVFEANLQAVETAGQARIETLDRQISEEESKLRQTLSTQIQEAVDWLKKNQKSLSESAATNALSNHPRTLEGFSSEEQDDFRWEIETYIESVYYSTLSGTYDLIDEPVISPSIKAPEAYRAALEFIKKRIPSRLKAEARETLSARFDYLLDRLFV